MGEKPFFPIDRYNQKEKPEFSVEKILPMRGTGIIWGASQSGKSLLCIRMAACLATGVPFVISESDEGKISNGGLVIYICGEGDEHLAGRILAAESALGNNLDLLPEGLNELPIICMGVSRWKLDTFSQAMFLKKDIAFKLKEYEEKYALKPRAIIFDTIMACFNVGDDNSNPEMEKVMSCLRDYGKAFDCLALGIAHPSKSREGRDGSIRGASSVYNSADVALYLEKDSKSDIRTLTVKKLRDGGSTDRSYYFMLQTYDDLPALIPISTKDTDSTPEKQKEKNTLKKKPDSKIITAIKSYGFSATRKEIQDVLLPVFISEYEAEHKKQANTDNIMRSINRHIGRAVLQKQIILTDNSYILADSPLLQKDEAQIQLEEEISKFESGSAAALTAFRRLSIPLQPAHVKANSMAVCDYEHNGQLDD